MDELDLEPAPKPAGGDEPAPASSVEEGGEGEQEIPAGGSETTAISAGMTEVELAPSQAPVVAVDEEVIFSREEEEASSATIRPQQQQHQQVPASQEVRAVFLTRISMAAAPRNCG